MSSCARTDFFHFNWLRLAGLAGFVQRISPEKGGFFTLYLFATESDSFGPLLNPVYFAVNLA
jgi:hypothetical protein